MRYEEVLDFLFNELAVFQHKGKSAYKGDLTNAQLLDKLCNHPHEKYKTIHVAGTNGKGSVSHMIAAGLQANGYTVGLFTSPHYKDYRERIKVNGKFIPKDKVVEFVSTHLDEIREISPSFFEITSAMAFDYFEKANVDVAVIEVGLGGRLDSTNIITPVLSIITNISFDHQSILGETMEKIAVEKAGIIKTGVPVVIGEKQEEIVETFCDMAKDQNATIHFADQEVDVLKESVENENDITIRNSDFDLNFTAPNDSFLFRNYITASFALFSLKREFNIKPNMVTAAWTNLNKLTYYIGRWMHVKESPNVIFDSAHNVAGVEYLVKQISKEKFKNLRIVWGSVRGKDIEAVLELLPKNAIYYFAKADNLRSIEADILRMKAKLFGLVGYDYPSVQTAYKTAIAESNSEDLIIVSGSNFVVAEVL